jgi:alpha-L-rhamnosidase
VEVARSVYRLCWDGARGLLADNPARQYFSQEGNALAVLLDVVPKRDQKAVLKRMLGSELGGTGPELGSNFSRASLYFRYYVARAVDHAGLADRYLELLGPWRRMLDLGLTTWAEKEEPTRSDDHAWSAHPNYDLLTLVAGIRPDAPGFQRVRIAPHLGRLTDVAASMPHPEGTIRVHYRRLEGSWIVNVELPKGLAGTLEWQGRAIPLPEGVSNLSFPL